MNHREFSRRRFLRTGIAAGAALTAAPQFAMAGTDSLERIRERGYLLYGFNGERPYNYTDAEGSLVGSEIDIARAVAKSIGIEEVQGVAMNFDSFIPALLAGRIDTCLPIFVKPARCEKVRYATPHLIEGQGCIVASGNPSGLNGWDDLVAKDVKVGLVAGTTPNEIAASVGLDKAKIVRFPDTTTLGAGVKSGRVDAIVEATSTIRLIYEQLDASKFERVADWQKPSDYSGSIEFYAAFPFSLDATPLRNEFDGVLQKMMASGEIEKLTASYGFGPSDRPAVGAPSLDQICSS
jgi:polar amino acid transport system substrate-binding protein